MQKFVKVRSTAETVQPVEINESSVIVNNGITEIHEAGTKEDPSSGFDGWGIDEQIIYEKDEYIALISQENSELGETVNSILTDIIPNLMA
jgi:hypothetical protein